MKASLIIGQDEVVDLLSAIGKEQRENGLGSCVDRHTQISFVLAHRNDFFIVETR
jgi:hypothetical protein